MYEMKLMKLFVMRLFSSSPNPSDYRTLLRIGIRICSSITKSILDFLEALQVDHSFFNLW